MPGYKIKEVLARQVFDSRANPTVEAEVRLECGAAGRSIVPSGASTGLYEALELRDNGEDFGGKGVNRVISNIREKLAPAILGADATDQVGIDNKLIAIDGTPDKSNLGANAILGVSMAVAYAAAQACGQPLFRYLGGANAKIIPVPMIQIIGGGAHAVGSIDIQDFLVIPMSAKNFAGGFKMAVDVYNATKQVFSKMGKPLSTADEGGFWPTGFKSNEEGLQILCEAIEKAGYSAGKDVAIAMDVAASEFYDKESQAYSFHLENRNFSREEFVDLLCLWASKYPIVSIEDGCSELDWEGSSLLTKKLGGTVQIIGDDLFTTNIGRIKQGIEKGACNAVLIKPNQIGTVTETLDCIEFTKSAGLLPVVSARSGETEDAFIVHLAIASGAGQLKVGSVARGERTAKWNEALRMEELLGRSGIYPSGGVFKMIKRN